MKTSYLSGKERGFTLIEVMTSVSVFLIIMTISMGSILGVFDANRKSRSLKAVLNNLNLSIESMSKEMRFGKNYHCGSSGVLTDPQNCPSGDTLVSFLSSENTQVTYRLNGSTIERSVDAEGYVPMTAPEAVVDSLTFYTLGAGTNNTLQPKIIMKLTGHVGIDESRTNFTLETLISQRVLDI